MNNTIGADYIRGFEVFSHFNEYDNKTRCIALLKVASCIILIVPIIVVSISVIQYFYSRIKNKEDSSPESLKTQRVWNEAMAIPAENKSKLIEINSIKENNSQSSSSELFKEEVREQVKEEVREQEGVLPDRSVFPPARPIGHPAPAPSKPEPIQLIKKKAPRLDYSSFSFIKSQPSDIHEFQNSINELSIENKKIALATYIHCYEIPIKEILSNFSPEDLLELSPYLNYLNLIDVDDDFIQLLVSSCKKISFLEINSSSLTELPISSLENCRRFNCNGCRSLEKLPNLPECRLLKCNDCSSLKELPELPNCQVITCNYTNLRFLPTMPCCKSIMCLFCPNLEEIGDQLRCIHLACSECPKLEKLPRVNESAFILSDHHLEFKVGRYSVETELLSTNPLKTIEAFDSYFQMNTEFPKVTYFTNGFLGEGVDNGGLSRDFLTKIIDAVFNRSGDSRNLENDKVVVIPAENELKSFEVNDEQVEGEEVKKSVRTSRKVKTLELCNYIPKAGGEETNLYYEIIGRLLAICYPLNGDYKTGYLFDEKVYDCLLIKENLEDLSNLWFLKAYLILRAIPSSLNFLVDSKQKVPNLYTDSLRDDGRLAAIPAGIFSREENSNVFVISSGNSANSISEEEPLIPPPETILSGDNPAGIAGRLELSKKDTELLNFLIDDDGEMLLKQGDLDDIEFRERIHQDLISKAKEDPSVKAIFHIAKGLNKGLKASLTNLSVIKSGSELKKRIEGSLSKEIVLNNLRWKTPLDQFKEEVEQTKNYLINWINSVTPHELEKFVFAATGLKGIVSNKHIEICLSTNKEGKAIHANTCNRQLIIPIVQKGQEFFNQKMEEFFMNALHETGFQKW